MKKLLQSQKLGKILEKSENFKRKKTIYIDLCKVKENKMDNKHYTGKQKVNKNLRKFSSSIKKFAK